jgi:hypothetical protein
LAFVLSLIVLPAFTRTMDGASVGAPRSAG